MAYYLLTDSRALRGDGGRDRERENPFFPLIFPSFFFLREFFSRAVLSERLEQTKALKIAISKSFETKMAPHESAVLA